MRGVDKITWLIRQQEKLRRSVLPLQPSENTIPRAALKALSSDFEQRYSLVVDSRYRGQKIHNAYAGTKYSESLMETVEQTARKLFRKQFADVRPISGHIAAMQVIGSLLGKGGRFLYIPIESGGYDGYLPNYLPSMLGVEGVQLPMKRWKVDYERMERIKGEFNAVVLGASIFLHPYDMKRIREKFPDSFILYDASHVLGLLAGGLFQKNLDIADVIYGSTHKNFPGPQGGLIVGKREVQNRIKEDPIWMYYDNFHLSRIAALGISMEYLSEHNYGETCIANTNALVKNLKERKIPLANIPEVTESGMFLLGYERIPSLSKRLEGASILVDSIGRIGLNEVTMRGLGLKHMDTVAQALEVALDGNLERARQLVKTLLKEMIWP